MPTNLTRGVTPQKSLSPSHLPPAFPVVLQIIMFEKLEILDYGDGECDDLATVSINGGERREIHLSNL